METLEAIRKRRAIRAYSEKEVPKSVLEDIVDAGRLAATGSNVQPWDFIVVTDKDMRKKIAMAAPNNGPCIEFAGACICVYCEDGKHPVEDGSAASQNMLVAATSYGLGSLWVAGYQKEYGKAIAGLLGIPDSHILISLIVVGYSESDNAPEVKKRELNSVLHWEKF